MTFFPRRPSSPSPRVPPPRSPRDARPARRARWHVPAVGALAIAGVIAVLGAVGASMAACSTAAFDSSFGPSSDSSIAPQDGAPAHDSSSGSDGALPGDSSIPAPTSVIAIHASPDLWDFRLCFGYGLKSDGSDAQIARHEPMPNDVTKPIARTNFPGVPISGGAPIAVTAEMMTELSMTPYVLWGAHIAALHAGRTCDELLKCGSAANCLAQGDYWPLNTLLPHAIAPGFTNLLVVTGCPPISGDPDASVAKCGPTYDAARGNLRAIVTNAQFQEQRPTTLHAAFANLNSIPSAVGPMNGSFGPLDPDAGPQQLLGTLVSLGDPVHEEALGLSLDASLAQFAAYGVTIRWTDLSDAGSVDDGGDASPVRALTMGLDAIQGFSDPSSVPGDFYARGPFLFAVVGDPTVPGGAPAVDGSIGEAALRALHVVAIPAFPADTSGIDAGR